MKRSDNELSRLFNRLESVAEIMLRGLLLLIITILYQIEVVLPFVTRINVQQYCSNQMTLFDSKQISYRNAKSDDLNKIAELCVDEFDGPFPWYKKMERLSKVNDLSQQLKLRYNTLILQERKHAMIIAVESANLSQDQPRIVGFVEVGMLPSPFFSSVELQDGIITRRREESLYLGNVVVNQEYRRQGIGRRLLYISIKVSQKFQEKELFVTVRKDNEAALAFYDSLGFELIDQSQLNPIFGTDSKNVAVLKYDLRGEEEISTISNG